MNACPKPGMISKALWVVILLFCFIPARYAEADRINDDDIGIFYNALAPYGNWVNHRNYGRVWYPRNVPRNWRPYTDGYWAFTIEYGWLWVSDWEWGWAPFHYGRWAWDDWYGWIWVPGRIWAPAWVFWRYGGGYAAWAPMPPNYIWRPYGGFQTYYFDHNRYLNWDSWVTVRERDFPRHHKHRRILAPQQNREILRVTNFINNVAIINNNVVNQGMPVQQIEKVAGGRLKPIVPIVLTESNVEKKQLRRDFRKEDPIIYRPKDVAMTLETIRDEEKHATLIADKVDKEPVTKQFRNLEQREPGRLTGKLRPIEYEDLPGLIPNLPKAQPVQRDMPLLTIPERRLESRVDFPKKQQPESYIRLREEANQLNQPVYQQQLEMRQQAEQEQRAREEARQQQEEFNRRQEMQRQQQLEMRQQAEQEQRAREEARQQQEEFSRRQEMQRQQQLEIRQQADQEQRAREEAWQQQEEFNRRQQLEMRQQAEQAQRSRRETQQQPEIVPQQETEQQQTEGQRQSDRGRGRWSVNRGERFR